MAYEIKEYYRDHVLFSFDGIKLIVGADGTPRYTVYEDALNALKAFLVGYECAFRMTHLGDPVPASVFVNSEPRKGDPIEIFKEMFQPKLQGEFNANLIRGEIEEHSFGLFSSAYDAMLAVLDLMRKPGVTGGCIRKANANAPSDDDTLAARSRRNKERLRRVEERLRSLRERRSAAKKRT